MIKITIAGPAGSGKSTIAQLIELTLDRVYIDSKTQDGEGGLDWRDDDRMALCLKAISQNQVVEIETVQTKM